MANVAVFVVVILLVGAVVYRLKYHGTGIVARRGVSIGADLGTLSDQPRVLVQAVTTSGPDRIRLVLAPEKSSAAGEGLGTPTDLDFVVLLRDDEFGYELLRQWQRSESPVALVIPPGSRLLRLRSIDDLQHLTLRRADDA